MLRLRPIPADVYARDVLPLTAKLWAGSRDFKTYVAQTNELARSAYGKRFYRTIGLFEGRQLLASCKRYERSMRLGTKRLSAVGIGAVFTPEQFRGKGYATALLAMLMDEARANGRDVAYLFSDIHPAFYKALGFEEFPSFVFSARADALRGARTACTTLRPRDWRDIARCFKALQSQERWAFERSPAMWGWIRLRFDHRSEHRSGQAVGLTLRTKRGLLAYVLGQREPKRDALIVDEFGWTGDEGQASIAALLRNAAGDLRRIAGWLPPPAAREALPRGSVRKRQDAIFMMAPLSMQGKRLIELGRSDGGIWATDHI